MGRHPALRGTILTAHTVLLICLAVACGHRAADAPIQSAATVGGGAAAGGAKESIVFDLGRDFAFSGNPNGPWRYGFIRGTKLVAKEFSLATVAAPTTPVGFWHAGQGKAGYYPYVAANRGATTAREPTESWAVRPGEVALEAGKTGQLAVVQFVAPGPGSYTITAEFAGIHKRLSTTDVHVLLDDETLFSGTINGYGGDPAFLPRQGASPTASYRATRVLRAGNVLSFAVGAGANKTHVNDTTGLMVTIRVAE
jgi:hypothetical protein